MDNVYGRGYGVEANGYVCVVVPPSRRPRQLRIRPKGRQDVTGGFQKVPSYAVLCTPIPAPQGSMGSIGVKTEHRATPAFLPRETTLDFP